MGLDPCELCWYQRIVMFPLVFVLAVGLATSDTQVFRYALPLVAAGWLVAAYHNLLYVGVIPEALQPCGAGPSCAKADLNLFGFISIPLLLLVAFTTRSEEHTSELQSLMRISYAVFCLKKQILQINIKRYKQERT